MCSHIKLTLETPHCQYPIIALLQHRIMAILQHNGVCSSILESCRGMYSRESQLVVDRESSLMFASKLLDRVFGLGRDGDGGYSS